MGDYNKNSVGEEASAFGQRVKGDVKEATGAVTGYRSLSGPVRRKRQLERPGSGPTAWLRVYSETAKAPSGPMARCRNADMEKTTLI